MAIRMILGCTWTASSYGGPKLGNCSFGGIQLLRSRPAPAKTTRLVMIAAADQLPSALPTGSEVAAPADAGTAGLVSELLM